ncbi:cutinase family protein [Mycobacteroides abscessus]|uniref:Cutinase, Cut3 n=1 Tax=Mycobacteroides abscessus subsp. massiliense TaxID=1962118 RepID=A0A1T7KGC5_9MYCO|nr:cutinase family protein [Mycobacteroides abscessus]ANO00513.1 cutinase [Mycobacteroides abscessus]EHM15308.1 cutinase Cut4 [Mycobacteroides abscessus subsp. massiliense CCUG 48898 = JCM 15300]MBL3750028.1 cutinase family protein [Mycobacteroides abscessus subsp. massiliense]MDM2642819.1 cutinase family protein [Mycobacteroides abscessus]MDM2652622.1 cutinase family protein [Mycobacteroides abscessus]
MNRYVKRGSVGVSIFAVSAAAAAVLANPSENSAIAAAAGCPDVDVSFARGTNDSPGLGDVGKAFTDELTDRLAGKSVDIYAVNYPASFDWVRAGDGANDMSYHVQEVARNCPNTQFVLGGFSQGAAVVDVLFGTNGTGLTFNNPLPTDLEKRVAAIVLIGNPKNWQVAGINLDLSIRDDQRSKIIDICNPGDGICDPNGGGLGPHMQYKSDGSADKAADFVAGRLAAVAASSSAAAASSSTSTTVSGVPASTSKSANPLSATTAPTPTSASPAPASSPSSSTPKPVAASTSRRVPAWMMPATDAPAADLPAAVTSTIPAPDPARHGPPPGPGGQ